MSAIYRPFVQITSNIPRHGRTVFAPTDTVRSAYPTHGLYFILAMKRAVEDMDTKPDVCLIDGNKTPEGLECPAIAVVKGDAKSQAVAAASILAKVARDRYMEQMAEQYPEYRFEKHKGYGTKLHYQMIDQYGPCGIHRMSFLKKYYAKKNGH